MTTLTSLNFSPNPNITNNGMFTPQLTQAEVNAIPVDESKIGGIIYNIDTQELQYLAPTLQWVNVASDEGEPTFTELTVTGPTTLNSLTVTTDATVGGNLTVTGTLIAPRPGASIYTSTVTPITLNTTPAKLTNVTTSRYTGHGFTDDGGTSNRVKYIQPTGYPASIDVSVTVNVNVTTLGGTGNYTVYLYKNGVDLNTTDTKCQVAGAPLSPINLSFTTKQTLAANDYLEVWMTCSASAANTQAISSMNVTAM